LLLSNNKVAKSFNREIERVLHNKYFQKQRHVGLFGLPGIKSHFHKVVRPNVVGVTFFTMCVFLRYWEALYGGDDRNNEMRKANERANQVAVVARNL
jgi:hypothetical protein